MGETIGRDIASEKLIDIDTLETSVDADTWFAEVDRIKKKLKLNRSDL